MHRGFGRLLINLPYETEQCLAAQAGLPMTAVSETLKSAVHFHREGQFERAGDLYRRILDADPDHPDALHLLGLIAKERREYQTAIHHIRRALELRPRNAVYLFNLGVVYQQLGDLDEAVRSYRTSLRARPDPETFYNLGVAEQARGHLSEAARSYERALELNPKCAAARNNLGSVQEAQGKHQEAARSYRRAAQATPDDPQILQNLARTAPRSPISSRDLNAQGRALFAQGRLRDAADRHQRALALDPDDAEAHNGLGCVLRQEGKTAEALANFQRAARLRPDYPDAHLNIGVSLFFDHGNLDRAMECFQRTLALNSQSVEAHIGRSLVWLLRGQFDQGWPEFEWRWRSEQSGRFHSRQPAWEGQPLKGKTLFLHSEQGFGDTIQFVRYAPLLRQRGCRVIVDCKKPLLGLLGTCAGIDQLVGRSEKLPSFDFHAPLLSLPRILGTTLANIPAQVPYLSAREDLVQHWGRRVRDHEKLTIGITWQGNPAHRADRYRSFPLRHFAGLAALPQVRLFSLQKGPGREQLHAAGFAVTDLGDELDRGPDAFLDTAAVMMHLDLVISSDTAAAHLAGALGRPVWVALRLVPDWRWLLDRDDSPGTPRCASSASARPGTGTRCSAGWPRPLGNAWKWRPRSDKLPACRLPINERNMTRGVQHAVPGRFRAWSSGNGANGVLRSSRQAGSTPRRICDLSLRGRAVHHEGHRAALVSLGHPGFLDVQSCDAMRRPILDRQVRRTRPFMEVQNPVLVVTLSRNEPRLPHEVTDDGLVQAVGRARGTDDVLLHHDAAHVVGPEEQPELSDLRSHRDPGASDRVDIVQVESAQGLHPQVFRGPGHSQPLAVQRMARILAREHRLVVIH